MIENYYQHYGLEKDPFPLDLEDELFFSTPELDHRLELINHLVEFSDRFIVVTGPAGSGKTTLLKQIARSVEDKWRVSKLPFKDIQSANDFFQHLFQEQNLEYKETDPASKKLATLQEHFARIHENNLLPVLMLDDGHRLSIELLKLLIDLATPEQNPGLHVVLFSSTDLTDLLSHKNLGYVHSVDLPGFTEGQTKSYIDFRLKDSGYEELEPLISEKMVAQIHKASDGRPGLINELAAKALNDPALEEEKLSLLTSISSILFNSKVTIPTALVLTAVFVVYILQNAEQEVEIKRVEVALPKIESTKVEDQIQENKSGDIKAELEADLQQAEIVVINVPKDKVKEPVEIKTEKGQVKQEQVKQEILSAVSPAAEVQTANQVEIAVQLHANAEIQANPVIKEAPKIIEAPSIEPKPVIPRVEPKLEIKQEAKGPDIQEVNKPEEKQQTIAVNKTVTTTISDVARSKIRGKSWLLKQSPEHYVLQLMGAHDGAVIDKFTSRHPEQRKDFARFKTVNQNKIWHVLLLGIYENRQQAVAALVGLPSKIRALKPWPRKLQTIHKDLK